MNRIRIRFIRCIGASVATLACVGLFPLSAAATDVDADAATPAAAQSGPQSGAQSGASTPTAPATPGHHLGVAAQPKRKKKRR